MLNFENKPMKMWWLCAFCIAFFGRNAQAVGLPQIPAFSMLRVSQQAKSGSSLVNDAHYLLKRGKNLSTCIDKLQKAIEQEPSNGPYHTDLGCALAGRAASLSHAVYYLPRFEQDKVTFQSRLAAWNIAAANQKENSLPKPARPTPPLLKTPDDNTPFTMTRKDAQSEFVRLAARAFLEWEQGIALQKGKPASEQAKAHYIRGYGILLLRRCANERFGGGEELMKLLPMRLQAIEEMEQAVQLAPDTAQYYQALGDAYGDGRSAKRQTINLTEAIAAYEKASTLKKNAAVWWRLYEIYHYSPAYPTDKAVDAIRRAVAYKSSNAFLWYRLANETFQETTFTSRSVKSKRRDKKVDLTNSLSSTENARIAHIAAGYVERGNGAAYFVPFVYEYAVPEEIHTAWSWIAGSDDSNSSSLLETITLYEAADAYARSLSNSGSQAEGEKMARAIIGMGRKMTTAVSLPTQEQRFFDVKASLLCRWAEAVTMDGYVVLLHITAKGGDESATARIRNEQSTIGAYFKQCRAAFQIAQVNSYGAY